MVEPLDWNPGEGYDIHVLRGGPASKDLSTGLDLDQSTNALPPVFIPHFKNAPSAFGVDVDKHTGEVRATAQPGPSQPRLANFNFLMTARQIVGGVTTKETLIRIHIHDSIQKIWLTPVRLTIHAGSSDGCRFSVLALFDDGTVGDITDWPQLSYKCVDPATQAVSTHVQVSSRGELTSETTGKRADITVTLKLTAPPVNFSAGAKVFTEPGWADMGKGATTRFVAGPVHPNRTDLWSTKPDSIDSVVMNRTNVLFVSEGFPKNQEQIFHRCVAQAVNWLRGKKTFPLFRLLRDAINYWSVFVASPEEGLSVLGDQQIAGPPAPPALAFQVPLPRPPTASAGNWTIENMLHQGGLPLPNDAPVQNAQAWRTSRTKFYDLPANAPLQQADVEVWNELRSRSLLNERDSAFGMAHYDRPRASGQNQIDGRLVNDERRTSGKSLHEFIENLAFGKDPPTGTPYSIGETWVENFRNLRPKDAGLICFVCWSGTRGSTWSLAPSLSSTSNQLPCFTASLNFGDRALVKAGTDGYDILPAIRTAISPTIFASYIAYGCGKAFGLDDEDGDGEGNRPGLTTVIGAGDNSQGEGALANITASGRAIAAKKIKWLWPRIIKAGMVKVEVDISGKVITPEKCDQNGTPTLTGKFLLVQMPKGAQPPFAKGDAVRLRALLTHSGSFFTWKNASSDAFAAFPLTVEKVINDKLVLGHQTPSLPQLGYLNPGAPQLDPALFNTVDICFLVAPRIEHGVELKLVADPIWKFIDTQDTSLNAPANSKGQTCTPAPYPREDVPASNLPQGITFRTPRPNKADIVGIYDGGFHFDCGVFRPAGRCRMRRGLKATTPFCQVCRYVIVDRVDPTQHLALDILYEQQYPR